MPRPSGLISRRNQHQRIACSCDLRECYFLDNRAASRGPCSCPARHLGEEEARNAAAPERHEPAASRAGMTDARAYSAQPIYAALAATLIIFLRTAS